MLYEIDNNKIGKYLSGLIERNYKSTRQFCIDYLKKSNIENPTNDEIRNMSNRLSQIKKGKKAIQIYDLPIFSNLLNVSYEQILSGGKHISSVQNRLTNYTVAQSHNKEDWLAYINDKNSPIMHPDEYEKTILDYAITFGNYKFIKFLVEEGYIWFDSRKDNDYIMTFGAGTSLQRVKFEEKETGVFIRKSDMNDLDYYIATEDQLRIYIISFAADYNDISMLNKLRAREIPELYFKAHYPFSPCPDFNIHYNQAVVSHIAKASDMVLDYFTEPFEIEELIKYKDGSNRKHQFVFPYISQLLDLMIVNNSTYLKQALIKMIQHNKNTEEKLQALIKQSNDDPLYCRNNFRKNNVEFHNNGNIIHFHDLHTKSLLTNIAKVTKKSNDFEINRLIQQLNNSYDCIKAMSQNRME